MAALDFNPKSAPPRENNFTVLPVGWYTADIVEADVSPTKSGRCVKIAMEVITQGYRGRKVWHRINFENASAQAQEIGQQQLAELCEVAGIERLTNTDQLLRKRVDLKLKISPAKGGYDESNDVSQYAAAGSKTGGAPAPAAQAQHQPAAQHQAAAPAAQPAVSATPPWAKRG
jgi:hypothetical protein